MSGGKNFYDNMDAYGNALLPYFSLSICVYLRYARAGFKNIRVFQLQGHLRSLPLFSLENPLFQYIRLSPRRRISFVYTYTSRGGEKKYSKSVSSQ